MLYPFWSHLTLALSFLASSDSWRDRWDYKWWGMAGTSWSNRISQLLAMICIYEFYLRSVVNLKPNRCSKYRAWLKVQPFLMTGENSGFGQWYEFYLRSVVNLRPNRCSKYRAWLRVQPFLMSGICMFWCVCHKQVVYLCGQVHANILCFSLPFCLCDRCKSRF